MLLFLRRIIKTKKNKMKKFLAIALIAVSFAACNDGEKKDETTGTADSLVIDANKMADEAKAMADSTNKAMADTMHNVMDTTSKMLDKAADKAKESTEKMMEKKKP